MENSIGLRGTSAPRNFNTLHLVLPLLISFGVAGTMFFNEFEMDTVQRLQFDTHSIVCIIVACLLMFLRDFGMIKRFRLLTDNHLNTTQAFHIHVLSEFTSAITPAAVGGSSLVILFLKKEGINAGRSTTIMFINLFLDELYFLIVCPLVFLFIPLNQLFNSSSLIIATFSYVFSVLYIGRLIWTIILYIGIFRKPQWIQAMLNTLFKLPLLRRFGNSIHHLTENLIQASHEMGNRSFRFWLKAVGLTFLTWTSRFLVVNVLFMAFRPEYLNHIVVFARQLILWVYMVISPTPGGSGVAEYAFKAYYSDIFQSSGTIILVTLVWRFISYYLYLLGGMILIPGWIKKTFERKVHSGF